MYQQHNKQEVHDMLAQHRIGTLKGAAAAAPAADPYANEPARHPALLTRADKPFNAETPPGILAAGLVTPTDMFYVR
jgi:sulfite oxidase